MSLVRPALTMVVLMTALLGLAYPLAMTAAAQALFPAQANGSLIERDGTVIGSAYVGQSFAAPHYLLPRPSAVDYDAANSSATNLAPTNAALVAAVFERSAAIREADGALPPVDRVTASASGLDPHLSPAGAIMQAERIATARDARPEAVRALIAAHAEDPLLGFIGEPVVNVLLTNLALDAAFPMPAAPATPGAASALPLEAVVPGAGSDG